MNRAVSFESDILSKRKSLPPQRENPENFMFLIESN